MNNYREILKQHFVEKKKKNSRFSMRAFAQVLGLSPAGLSQILSGKKDLSLDRALEISKKLKLPEDQSDSFLLQVQLERAKSTSLKDNLLRSWESRFGRLPTQDLSVEHFRLISDWYGMAILEALKSGTQDRPISVKRLALTFSLDVTTVEVAISHLENLKLIRKVGKLGYVSESREWISVQSDVPSEAIQNYYKSVIDRVLHAIENISPAHKIIGAHSITLCASQLKEVEKIRQEYITKLIQLSNQNIANTVLDGKAIYKHFEVLFPVSLPIHTKPSKAGASK